MKKEKYNQYIYKSEWQLRNVHAKPSKRTTPCFPIFPRSHQSPSPVNLLPMSRSDQSFTAIVLARVLIIFPLQPLPSTWSSCHWTHFYQAVSQESMIFLKEQQQQNLTIFLTKILSLPNVRDKIQLPGFGTKDPPEDSVRFLKHIFCHSFDTPSPAPVKLNPLKFSNMPLRSPSASLCICLSLWLEEHTPNPPFKPQLRHWTLGKAYLR